MSIEVRGFEALNGCKLGKEELILCTKQNKMYSDELILRKIGSIFEKRWATKNLEINELGRWENLVQYSINVPDDYKYYIVQSRSLDHNEQFYSHEHRFILYDPTNVERNIIECPSIYFYFVSDMKYRTAIDHDYEELKKHCKNEAIKSIYIIAGSIIEAILTDQLLFKSESAEKKYLIFFGNKFADQIPKWYLSRKITVAKELDIINGQIAMLLRDLKDHRNLVHISHQIESGFEVDFECARIILKYMKRLCDHLNKNNGNHLIFN